MKIFKTILLCISISVPGFYVHASWTGKIYTQNSRPQFENALEFLQTFVFKGDEMVCDVGCGSGITTYEMKKRFIPNGRVIGVDSSESMIHQAQQDFKSISGLTFLIGDASTFSLAEKCDVITTFFCWHWIKPYSSVELAAKAVFTNLKSQGWLFGCLTLDDTPEHPSPSRQSIKKTCQSAKWAEYFIDLELATNSTDISDYQKALEQAGFVNISLEVVYPDVLFKNKDELVGFKSTFPISGNVPDALRKNYYQDVAQSLVDIVGENADGTVPYKRPVLKIRAQKP